MNIIKTFLIFTKFSNDIIQKKFRVKSGLIIRNEMENQCIISDFSRRIKTKTQRYLNKTIIERLVKTIFFFFYGILIL